MSWPVDAAPAPAGYPGFPAHQGISHGHPSHQHPSSRGISHGDPAGPVGVTLEGHPELLHPFGGQAPTVSILPNGQMMMTLANHHTFMLVPVSDGTGPRPGMPLGAPPARPPGSTAGEAPVAECDIAASLFRVSVLKMFCDQSMCEKARPSCACTFSADPK